MEAGSFQASAGYLTTERTKTERAALQLAEHRGRAECRKRAANQRIRLGGLTSQAELPSSLYLVWLRGGEEEGNFPD